MALKYLHAALISPWSEIIYIDVEILNKIGDWLASQQAADGSFPETEEFLTDRSFTVSHCRLLLLCTQFYLCQLITFVSTTIDLSLFAFSPTLYPKKQIQI